MVALPDMTLPTIKKIYQSYEKTGGDHRRNHLGASLIGNGCERSLFYTFRWASTPKIEGRIYRLFETGIQQESRIVKNLRDIGIEVYDLDPETGKQIHYEMFGGHYAGSLDGVGMGFEESTQPHVLEFKTSNKKQFDSLAKTGIERAKFMHYCQVQQYMKWSELERAYYFCVCKDDDSIYGERINLDKQFVSRLESKAERVIFADIPPFKITDSPEDFRCKYCDHKDICHGNKLPDVNCRTCAYSNPERDGTWICTKDDNRVLCGDEQRSIHKCHIFIPDFVKLEQIEADPDKGTITYAGNITNGPGAIESKDLQEHIK